MVYFGAGQELLPLVATLTLTGRVGQMISY